jgi:hypothetical protein
MGMKSVKKQKLLGILFALLVMFIVSSNAALCNFIWYLEAVSPKMDFWNKLNYWVMHPVARVSIKYWKNLRKQQSIL